MNDIKQKIEYKKNLELKEFTTLKIGGNAQIAYFPKTQEEFSYVLENLKEKPIVIGNGSNLLISSNGIEKPVIITKKYNNITKIDKNKVKVEAGTASPLFAKFALNHSLSGVAFLIGIPGTIGGAITMNSSAHGEKIEDILVEACIYDFDKKETVILKNKEMEFAYRTSILTQKPNYILLWAVLKLENSTQKEIKEKMDFHINYRAQNHPPLTMPSAGSTFKNPKREVPVGKLLEELGAKSWGINDAKVSTQHANFVINIHNATSLDMLNLMLKMHNEVKSNYGYEVHTEIKFIGNATKEEEEIWAILKG